MKDDKVLFHDILAQMICEVFSPEMAEYLCENIQLLEKWQIGDAIKGAMIPLKRKRDWFYQLAEFENMEMELLQVEDDDEKERITEQSYQYIAMHMEEALSELHATGKDNSFLIVNEMEIDLFSDCGEKIVGTIPFRSYYKFKTYLQEYYEFEENLDYKWHLVEKYKNIDADDVELAYTYIYYKGEPLFYRNEVYDIACWGNPDLNLPIFGYPGELYETDGRPFNEPKRFLMLEKSDNHDCCAVQVLVIDDERVRSTALKHGWMFYNRWPKAGVSPLYGLHSFNEKMPETEEVLYTAKDFMNGCEAAGRLLGYVRAVSVEEFTKELLDDLINRNVR